LKKRICLLYGGRSAEREISLLSAFSVLSELCYEHYEVQTIFITHKGLWIKGPLLSEKPILVDVLKVGNKNIISPSELTKMGEIAFPVLHGPMGEDGTIQGFLEIIGMPYVGAGVLTSAVAMDKIMTKYILHNSEIPQLPFAPVLKNRWRREPDSIFEKIEKILNYPVFVKPANLGSSVGISRAENRIKLEEALELAFTYDSRALVEQAVEAREIEVGILGNVEEVRVTDAGEIVKDGSFYDYQAKYLDNKIEMVIPAEISEKTQEKVRSYAKKAYALLAGTGLSRCDFFLTAGGELYLNEINTMPGFTQFSMYPLLWKNNGLNYAGLIEELIQLAQKRFSERQAYFAN